MKILLCLLVLNGGLKAPKPLEISPVVKFHSVKSKKDHSISGLINKKSRDIILYTRPCFHYDNTKLCIYSNNIIQPPVHFVITIRF